MRNHFTMRRITVKEEKKERAKNVESATLLGPIWYIGWLFTVAFAKLSFWKALLALVVWPYFLGTSVAG